MKKYVNKSDHWQFQSIIGQPSAHEQLVARVDELRIDVRKRDPIMLAAHTGAEFLPYPEGEGEFRFQFWNQEIALDFPGLQASLIGSKNLLPGFIQALIVYYFHTSDGTQLSGKWVSFAELLDGRMYAQAFQGYTGDEIVRKFRNDVQLFSASASMLNGTRVNLSDAGFCFYALPNLPLLVTYWQGDEEFPPSCKLLFDSSANHYMPTDVCAILGSMLTKRIIKG